MEGKYQKDIAELPSLESYRYENIFKVYEFDSKYFKYNIIKKLQIPDDINEDYFFYYVFQKNVPWTTLSYQAYGTTQLWWLICLVNKITNPLSSAVIGKQIKIIKKEYIKLIIDSITSQLQ